MIKDIAWHFFKKTGDVSTFLEYKISQKNEIKEQLINDKIGDMFGNSKNEGNSNKSSQFQRNR